MIINEEGTYTLRYTATDDCGKTTTVDRELVVAENIPTVSWSDGTDEEIVAMVKAADEGKINLADYWNVGDRRSVSLSAMEAIGVGESHEAQNVTLILMNAGGKTLNTPTESGRTECSFIVGVSQLLKESGYINSDRTNTGGWESSARRAWCNNVFYNAIPSTLKPIFKQHLNKTADGGSGATASVESVDYFALPAEYEVFGAYTNSSSIYEAGLTQFEWYMTSTNRIKRQDGSQDYWWERSPSANNSTNFCRVTSNGFADNERSSYRCGITPFGAI